MTENEQASSASWAGWRILLFALLLPSVVTAVYFQLLHGSGTLRQQMAFAVGKTIQFGFPIVWVWRTAPNQIQFKCPTRVGILPGVLLGIAVVIAMLALYHGWLKPASTDMPMFSQVKEKLAGLGIDSVWKYALLGLFYAVVHAFLEEYYWRWFVFGWLRKVVSRSTAILISSVGFMAHHVIVLAFYFGWTSPLTYLFSISVAVGGAMWAWLYDRSNSIYSVWLSHLLVDAGIFLVGYDIAQDLFGG